MNLPKQKIALAPVLAVVLALLLVGVAASFPPTQQERQNQLVTTTGGVPSPQPQPSDNQFFQQSAAPSPTSVPPELPTPSNTQDDERTWPIPKPTTLPTPSPAPETPVSSEGANSVLPLIFIVAAIVVAVVSVRVIFSEKNLNRT